LNITLYLQLEAKRDAIKDVAAIYLIKPCKESIMRIVEDLNSELYDYLFVNFISPCPDDLLEYFAIECGRYNNQSKIIQVYDHYLALFAPTPKMFSLELNESYILMNRIPGEEVEVDRHLESIALGIYNFLRTVHYDPYIRFEKEDIFGEQIAKKLCVLFNKYERPEDEKYEYGIRPILMLVNRNHDIHTLLHHPWNYFAITHDVLGISYGKVTIPGSSSSAKKQEHELDYLNDSFLQTFGLKEFQVVAESIEEQYAKWKNDYEGMSGKKAGEESKEDIAAKLGEAIEHVPEMTERKKNLDAHTVIVSNLYAHIKRRNLNELVNTELEIMTSKSVSSQIKEQMKAIFRSKPIISASLSGKPVESPAETGKPVATSSPSLSPAEEEAIMKKASLDRLRLLLLYVQCMETLDEEEINELKSILIENYPDMKFESLEYLIRKKKEETSSMGGQDKTQKGGLRGVFNSKQLDLYRLDLAKGISYVTQGLKATEKVNIAEYI
jgi:hypothetical protein